MNHVEHASDLVIQWCKSSRSKQGSECVEVGRTAGFTAVRDSKDPHGPALVFSKAAFTALVRSSRSGDTNIV